MSASGGNKNKRIQHHIYTDVNETNKKNRQNVYV